MILLFPRVHRSRIEAFTVRERDGNRRLHILEFVGCDEAGPFRIDVGHYHESGEMLDAARVWMRDGIDVVDGGLFV